MTNKSHKLAVILQMRGTFVNLEINMHIFRYFPVKVFFILMCVVALMVPVSADPFSPNTPTRSDLPHPYRKFVCFFSGLSR